MKFIDTYILEKLHINKDTKVFSPEKDLKYKGELSKLFDNKGFHDDFCNYLIKTSRNKNVLIRMYAELMYITNSMPFINKNGKICSYYGNFGQPIIDKAIKLGAEPEDFIKEYEKIYDGELHEMPKDLNDFLYNKIYYVFDNGAYKINDYKFLFNEGIDIYSKDADDIISNGEKRIIIPVEVTLQQFNKKGIVKCEIACSSLAYYYYICDGKKFRWTQDFYKEIDKYLK